MRGTTWTVAVALGGLIFVAALAVGGAACDDDNPTTCQYDGETYELGDDFPATDGCNSCHCLEEGVGCTVMACADAGP